MEKLKDLLFFRALPLFIGWVAMRFWGSDTKDREAVIFCLGTFAAHAMLSMFDVASAVDRLSSKVTALERLKEKALD
jgi:hypothetical protein